jgi:hypothetical protein
MKVSHCLSEDMIADFFTKPFEGKQFVKLRDLILNMEPKSASLGTPLEHRGMLDNSTEGCSKRVT